ncbi:MAG TPA: FAD:protein FMN transferase, partial [Flavisolibacter sp.]|nr:FAD:protein FMN transferase [Flavisolibacter sp.]
FNYLAEIGGELRVRGTKQPSGEPMTIGIESPEAEDSYGAPLQRYLQVQQGAFTTSGNYRRYYLSGDKAISHLLDPRSGFPVNNELISVTVWAPDAITADAIDNALMVMGLEKALKYVADRKNLEAYFIYKKNDGTVGDTATAGFYRFFKQD